MARTEIGGAIVIPFLYNEMMPMNDTDDARKRVRR